MTSPACGGNPQSDGEVLSQSLVGPKRSMLMVTTVLAPEHRTHLGLVTTLVKEEDFLTVAAFTRKVVEVAAGRWLVTICRDVAGGPEKEEVRAVAITYGDGYHTTLRLTDGDFEPCHTRFLRLGLSVTPETVMEIDHENHPVLDPTLPIWDVVSANVDLCGTESLNFWVRWDDVVPLSAVAYRVGGRDSQGRSLESEIGLQITEDGAGKEIVWLDFRSGAPVSRDVQTLASATASPESEKRQRPSSEQDLPDDAREPPKKKRRVRTKRQSVATRQKTPQKRQQQSSEREAPDDERKPPAKKGRGRKLVDEWGFTLEEERVMMKMFHDNFEPMEPVNPWGFNHKEEKALMSHFLAEMSPIQGTSITPMKDPAPQSGSKRRPPKTAHPKRKAASARNKIGSGGTQEQQKSPEKLESQSMKRNFVATRQDTPKTTSQGKTGSASSNNETPKKKAGNSKNGSTSKV